MIAPFFPVLLVSVPVALAFYIDRRWRRRCAPLVRHFAGTYSAASWGVEFTFEGVRFHLDRISNGSGAKGTGSSPMLFCRVFSGERLFLGHALSGKYAYFGECARFRQSFSFAGGEFVLAAESATRAHELRERLEARLRGLLRVLDSLEDALEVRTSTA